MLAWAAQYNVWLPIKLTLKGAVPPLPLSSPPLSFSFLSFSFSLRVQTGWSCFASSMTKLAHRCVTVLLYMHGAQAAFSDQCRSMMCPCSDISCGSYAPCYALQFQHQLRALLLLLLLRTAASHLKAAAAAKCCITFQGSYSDVIEGQGWVATGTHALDTCTAQSSYLPTTLHLSVAVMHPLASKKCCCMTLQNCCCKLAVSFLAGCSLLHKPNTCCCCCAV